MDVILHVPVLMELIQLIKVVLKKINVVHIPFTGDLEDILAITKQADYLDSYQFLSGKSRTGTSHMVIVSNGEIIHDPSLDDSGIIGPADNVYYWLGFLVQTSIDLYNGRR